MSDTVVEGKDQEALMKLEGAEPQFGHAMYGAPPPPYYCGPAAAGDVGYAPAPMQAIVMQPQGGVHYLQPVAAAQTIPDHLIYAVMATICCCWPLGLFAIFKSIECRNAINRGDVSQAMQLSKQTRRLANWTVGIGVLFVVLSFVIMGVYIWLSLTHMHRMGGH